MGLVCGKSTALVSLSNINYIHGSLQNEFGKTQENVPVRATDNEVSSKIGADNICDDGERTQIKWGNNIM